MSSGRQIHFSKNYNIPFQHSPSAIFEDHLLALLPVDDFLPQSKHFVLNVLTQKLFVAISFSELCELVSVYNWKLEMCKKA